MRLALTISLLLAMSTTALAAPDDVEGVWMTEDSGSKVEIRDCGDGTPCGRLMWLDDPDAAELRDPKNPDPALRDRPRIGLLMLWGFAREDGVWKNGRVYNPESGKTYRAHLERLEDGRLKLTGCLAFFCGSEKWTPTTL